MGGRSSAARSAVSRSSTRLKLIHRHERSSGRDAVPATLRIREPLNLRIRDRLLSALFHSSRRALYQPDPRSWFVPDFVVMRINPLACRPFWAV